MTNKPIGILDSGIGGLSVYKEIVALLPHEPVVYIGDNAQAPYGVLPAEDIYERSVELMSFLLEKDVKLIVVACNTITVCCIEKLRNTFPHVPIIGTVPVVKTAAAVTRNNKIGILSTTRTAESAYQHELIRKFTSDKTVINLGTDELVPLIEQEILEGTQLEEVLKGVLTDFQKAHIDTLALGCTHYPFIENEMQKVLGDSVQILDSGEAIARQVQRVLEGNNSLADIKIPSQSFYTTGEASRFDRIAKKFLGATIASTTVVL